MHNTFERTNEIYGNCLVKSPDGISMFRCETKKANWYLERNLAIVISEEPYEIQLTFKPDGNGHVNDEYYLGQKENRCVVCGTNDLSVLTKHHIVPYEYRKHFPLEFKQHSSHDIVAICKKHHKEYEINHASILKKILSEIYNAPLNITKNEKKILLSFSYASALHKHGEKMSNERKEEMIAYIQFFKKEKITDEIIKNLAETDIYKFLNLGKKHGEIVFKNVKENLQEFVELWRTNFIEKTNPQFMPKGWSIKRSIYQFK